MNTREFLGLDEARELLRASVDAIDAPGETVALDAALHRVSAHAIVSPIHVPPFRASAMDGYAVCTRDPIFERDPPFTLALHGESRAGAPMTAPTRTDHAVRIFTGAAMPQGCDSVVIQEDVERSAATIALRTRPSPGNNVRPEGHDVARGETIVDAGLSFGPFDLAWLTACGLTRVDVRAKLRLAVFSTGDELRDPPAVLQPGQIYDANRFVLRQLLRDAPIEVTDLGILPDDPARIEAALRVAAEAHHVVVTSGGVSVGDADYVRAIVERLGRIEFWKIAIKPGKPLAYGRIGRCHFFGLPGNPVSTIVTFLLLVKPILAKLAGANEQAPIAIPARLAVDVAHEPGRVEYQRGSFRHQGDGLIVTPTSDQSSNRIGSFRGANCLIEIPRSSGDLRSGSAVAIIPLTDLLR